jgi:hypothetical protein
MVCDVDTVFTGRVLDIRAQSDAPFFVDNEQLSDADFKRLYYDWHALAGIDPDVQSARKSFNVGQWFGTAGLVDRDEFNQWVEWTLPRRLHYPDLFMGGDQGVMNYVILKKEALEGLRIERQTIMRWPGHSIDGLDVESVSKGTKPPLVIHWAGMKSIFLRNMVGTDLLRFFENYYYRQIPAGNVRKIFALCYHVWLHLKHWVVVRCTLRWRMLFGVSFDPRIVTPRIG